VSILPLAGAFVAAFLGTLFVFDVARRLVKLALPLFALKRSRYEIAGGHGLGMQPDQITLLPAGAEPWSDRAAAGRLVLGLERLGFRSAGAFAIEQMLGVLAQLFAHPEEHFLGVVYEHPQTGHWFDVVERRSDGSSTTWTTAPESGLARRAEHPHVHEPGATPEALFARALRERGPAPAEAIRIAEVEAIFEREYAEETAWRKNRGVSREEVQRIERDVLRAA